MNKVIFTGLIALASAASMAEGPLIAGQQDLILDFQGDTAIGVLHALDSQKAAYVVLDSFYTSKFRDYNYNGTSQDLLDTTKTMIIQIQAGMQYYLDDNMFGLAEIGYYRWTRKTDDADPVLSDLGEKESGLNAAIGIGISHDLTEKLSLVVKSKMTIMNWTYTGETIPPAGATTPLNEEKWGTKSLSYALGLTYNIK